MAIDTNVLVRLLVRDDEAQFASAQQLVAGASAADEPVLIVLGALLEAEWVLRSRYKLDKASISSAFAQLLESSDVEFEHEPTVEEALYLWALHPGADFADCLLNARAAHLGRARFVTFDAGAAKLPTTDRIDARATGRDGTGGEHWPAHRVVPFGRNLRCRSSHARGA